MDNKVECLFNNGSKEEDMLALIDGAYDLVEIWEVAGGEYNEKWKTAWLKRARELGANPSY